MCPQERISIYKKSPSVYPLCSKGLGHLLHLAIIYFTCFYLLVAYSRKPIKSFLSVLAVIPCLRSLVITFCSSLGSTLLLIEKDTIDPLHLWVIRCFPWIRSHRLSRSCAMFLLVRWRFIA